MLTIYLSDLITAIETGNIDGLTKALIEAKIWLTGRNPTAEPRIHEEALAVFINENQLLACVLNQTKHLGTLTHMVKKLLEFGANPNPVVSGAASTSNNLQLLVAAIFRVDGNLAAKCG